MKNPPSDEYLEKAKLLSKEDVEHLFARMRGKLARRLGDRDLSPVEAIALQLEFEDEKLKEWREQWAEISDRENKKRGKKD